MTLEQLERAEKWIDREMRQLQPRVEVVVDVFGPDDQRAVRISGLRPEGKQQ